MKAGEGMKKGWNRQVGGCGDRKGKGDRTGRGVEQVGLGCTASMGLREHGGSRVFDERRDGAYDLGDLRGLEHGDR